MHLEEVLSDSFPKSLKKYFRYTGLALDLFSYQGAIFRVNSSMLGAFLYTITLCILLLYFHFYLYYINIGIPSDGGTTRSIEPSRLVKGHILEMVARSS